MSLSFSYKPCNCPRCILYFDGIKVLGCNVKNLIVKNQEYSYHDLLMKKNEEIFKEVFPGLSLDLYSKMMFLRNVFNEEKIYDIHFFKDKLYNILLTKWNIKDDIKMKIFENFYISSLKMKEIEKNLILFYNRISFLNLNSLFLLPNIIILYNRIKERIERFNEKIQTFYIKVKEKKDFEDVYNVILKEFYIEYNNIPKENIPEILSLFDRYKFYFDISFSLSS